MSAYDSIALLLTLSALLAYVNYRWVKLPMTIGVMAVGLLLSLGLIALDAAGMDLRTPARTFLAGLHFDKVLMHGMLSYLLFAGALHINLDDLAREKTVVGVMASVGIALSTFLVGTAMYGLTQLVGMEVSYLYCLVFGALISPTDPIAVLGILKTAGTPKSLETKIAGESLFNDGIGVVIFLVLVELATGQEASFGHIVKLFAVEGLGGVALGMVLGLCTYRLLRDVDNYQVEVLLTLALVGGGYALAMKLHTSGPIAVVVAGLFIGNHGRQFCDVRKNAGTSGRVLGIGRRNSERGPVCVDRSRAAGAGFRAHLLWTGTGGDRDRAAGSPDCGFEYGHCAAVQPPVQSARDSHSDLGRNPWRHLRSAGAVFTTEQRARLDSCSYVSGSHI